MALSSLGNRRGGDSVAAMASQLVGGYRVGGYRALACFTAKWNSVRANRPASSIN
jgi:hypothetical protein